MADYTTYFNGEWIPYSEVKIDPNDRGFIGGDVVFDVARTFDGKSFRMREHVDRLYRSLAYVRIDCGLSKQEMTGHQRGGGRPQRGCQGRGGRLLHLAVCDQRAGRQSARRRASHGVREVDAGRVQRLRPLL